MIITISTSTGTDSLENGVEGSILFNIDANGVELGGLQLSPRLTFTNGNVIGPISDSTNFFFSPASAVLEILAFDYSVGNGTDPDSIRFGAANLSGPGWTGSGEFSRFTFIPSDIGTIVFDTAYSGDNQTFVSDMFGEQQPIVWVMDTIYVVPPPVPPINGDMNCDSTVTSSDIIFMVNYVFKGGPGPPQECQ